MRCLPGFSHRVRRFAGGPTGAGEKKSQPSVGGCFYVVYRKS